MALLPKNQRDQTMVLVCILAVVLAVVYWNYVWSPKNESLNVLAQRVDTLEARNNAAREDVAKGTIAQLQAEAEQYARELEVMRQLVPTSNELPLLLDQVSTAARREGLEIAAIEPLPVVQGEIFDTYRYRIAVPGSYHEVARFLTNVGSLTRIVAPINLQVGPTNNPNSSAARLRAPNTAPLDSRFEIQTYVIRTAPRAQGGQS